MKTTIRAFQREFPRMRKLAAAGKTVIVEAGGQTFEFHVRRQDSGVLGCMAGRAHFDKLREGPVVPLEEWGKLGK